MKTPKPKYPANIPTSLGDKIMAVITAPDSLIKMEALSRADLPAVQGISQALLDSCGATIKENHVKQFVGRKVCDYLTPKGFIKTEKRDCHKDPVFVTGTIYRVPTKAESIHLFFDESQELDPRVQQVADLARSLGLDVCVAEDIYGRLM